LVSLLLQHTLPVNAVSEKILEICADLGKTYVFQNETIQSEFLELLLNGFVGTKAAAAQMNLAGNKRERQRERETDRERQRDREAKREREREIFKHISL